MSSVFEDHLALDAIVAFADGEMSLVAYQRAAAHLDRCERCSAEVAEQTCAREFLRSAGAPRMPSGLFDALRSIPLASAPVQRRGVEPSRRGGIRRFRLTSVSPGPRSTDPDDLVGGPDATRLPGPVDPFDRRSGDAR
jgi:anti-sigma factor RsiW